MAHADCAVRLVVEQTRNASNGTSWNEFLGKHDRLTYGGIRHMAPHVESKIHLFEGAMAWHRDAPHPRVDEAETDEAHDV